MITKHEPARRLGTDLGCMAKFSPHTSSSVGASRSPCVRDSNTAHSVELATVWTKCVADGEEIEKTNNGRTPMARTTDVEMAEPDVSTIEIRMLAWSDRPQS